MKSEAGHQGGWSQDKSQPREWAPFFRDPGCRFSANEVKGKRSSRNANENRYPVYIRVHLRTTRIDANVVIVDSLPTTANPPTTLPRQTVSPCFPRPTWIIPFHATLPMIMYFITQHTRPHVHRDTNTRQIHTHTHTRATDAYRHTDHIQHIHNQIPDRHT